MTEYNIKNTHTQSNIERLPKIDQQLETKIWAKLIKTNQF